MAFDTLEQRFQQRAAAIYDKYNLKTSRTSAPYIEIKPNSNESRSRIIDDSRAMPVVATKRDITRISRFLRGSDGLLFLAKQTLLQTGNTFSETRLYRPTEVLENIVPFVHSKRATSIGSKITKLFNLQDYAGGLQDSTIRKYSVSAYGGSQKLSGVVKTKLRALQDQLFSPLVGQLESVRNIPMGSSAWKYNRPEFKVFGEGSAFNPFLAESQPLAQRTIAKGSVIIQSDRAESLLNAKKLFQAHRAYTESQRTEHFSPSMRSPANGKAGYRDNLDSRTIAKGTYTDQVSYSGVEQPELGPDMLPFAFAVNGKAPVQFRAFIDSLKENVTTEFSEKKYLGRIERFVTYVGAKRNCAIAFKLAAFSDLDIEHLWLRLNYLTGLAFPKDISISGFIVPPLFRVTIGNIYSNQPCYVSSIDYVLIDNDITVDQGVSKLIKVTMNLVLLEKVTRVYDSPFYSIAESRFTGTESRPTTIIDNVPFVRRTLVTGSISTTAPLQEALQKEIQNINRQTPPIRPDNTRVALPPPLTMRDRNRAFDNFVLTDIPRPSLDKLANPVPAPNSIFDLPKSSIVTPPDIIKRSP